MASSDKPSRPSASNAMPLWENNPHPVFHFPASAPSITATSTIRKWRAESPVGAWPAPIDYSSNSGKQGGSSSKVRNSPPPPDVYRHGSMHSMERRLPSSHNESARNPGNHDPPTRSVRTSPQLGGSTRRAKQDDRRATLDGDEAAYWSGFEDGIQYERQRQAFERRSGQSAVKVYPPWY